MNFLSTVIHPYPRRLSPGECKLMQPYEHIIPLPTPGPPVTPLVSVEETRKIRLSELRAKGYRIDKVLKRVIVGGLERI